MKKNGASRQANPACGGREYDLQADHKPRFPAWRRALLEALISPILAVALFFLGNLRHGAVGFFVGGCAGSILMVLFRIYRERRSRRPLHHFWDDGSGNRIVVRHLRTGEVLLLASRPSLAHSDLRGLDLSGADLRDLEFERANLQGIHLRGADLRGSRLVGANLCQTDLSHARMASATLAQADLRGADLRGTDFVGRGVGRTIWDSDLSKAALRGAIFNTRTRWPVGFHPLEHGCVLVEDQGSFPIPGKGGTADRTDLPLPAVVGVPESASLLRSRRIQEKE